MHTFRKNITIHLNSLDSTEGIGSLADPLYYLLDVFELFLSTYY